MSLFASQAQAEAYLTAAKLAEASYWYDEPPEGWLSVGMTSLGINQTGFEYTGAAASSNAHVYVTGYTQQDQVVISFTGSVDQDDWIQNGYAGGSENGDYWENFIPLIDAVKAAYPNQSITFVGHSLGGAAVNQILDHASTLGLSANDKFYAFESPYQTLNAAIQNWGLQNDPINGFYQHDTFMPYVKVISEQYSWMEPVDTVKDIHGVGQQISIIDRIIHSPLYEYMIPQDKVVIVDYDDWSGVLDASEHGAQNNTFYFGNDNTAFVFGSGYNDYIDAGRGSSTVYSSLGNDVVAGGDGSDTFVFTTETAFGNFVNQEDVVKDFHISLDRTEKIYDWETGSYVDITVTDRDILDLTKVRGVAGYEGLVENSTEVYNINTAKTDLVITGTHDTIVLENVSKNELLATFSENWLGQMTSDSILLNQAPVVTEQAAAYLGFADQVLSFQAFANDDGGFVAGEDFVFSFDPATAPQGFSIASNGEWIWDYQGSVSSDMSLELEAAFTVTDRYGAETEGHVSVIWMGPLGGGYDLMI